MQIIAGGDLQLTTASDNIGTLAVPLTYRIGGHLVAASAGRDAFLRTDDRDMVIGRVFAQGQAQLTAESGSIVGYLDGVAIAATDIHLEASANAGTAGNALSLQVGSSGVLSGVVGSLANIYSPTQSGQEAIELSVANFTAGTAEFVADADLSMSQVATTGNLKASAGADLTLSDVVAGGNLTGTAIADLAVENVSAGGGIAFDAGGATRVTGTAQTVMAGANLNVVGGSLQMDDGSGLVAGGVIDIATSGAAIIGGLKTNLVSETAVIGIRISADRIHTSGTTLANLQASDAKIEAHLTAKNGIGLLSAPITVQGPKITASTIDGAVSISGFDGHVAFNSLVSEKGTVIVKAIAGRVDGTIARARNLVRIHGADGVAINRVHSGLGNVHVTADGNVNIVTAIAGRSSNISSAAGNLVLGNSRARISQRLHGARLLRFGSLRSGRDIIGSSRGAIFGRHVIAGRNIKLDGRSIDLTTARGGPVIMLLSHRDIKARTLKARGKILAVARTGGIVADIVDARSVVLHSRKKPRIRVLRVRDPRQKFTQPIETVLGSG